MLDEVLKLLETMKSIVCGLFYAIPYSILPNVFLMRGDFQSVCSVYINKIILSYLRKLSYIISEQGWS